MPFICDETQIEWPEDDDWEPPPRRADQFVYLSPPEYARLRSETPYGSSGDPVRFSAEPVTDAAGASGPPSRQRREREERLRRQFFSVVMPELQNAGARRVYCRYDGAQDEGFCWLDRFEMQDGQRAGVAQLTGLLDARLLDKLTAVNLAPLTSNSLLANDALPDTEKLEIVLDDLCREWATMLLGYSFGAGDVAMYGAFTVDLEACTITDDRNADFVVENIEITT